MTAPVRYVCVWCEPNHLITYGAAYYAGKDAQ